MTDRETLLQLLQDICPGVDFAHEQDLVRDGLLQSLDLVTAVAEMIDVFGVKLTAVDLVPENFRSVDTMLDMLRRKKR